MYYLPVYKFSRSRYVRYVPSANFSRNDFLRMFMAMHLINNRRGNPHLTAGMISAGKIPYNQNEIDQAYEQAQKTWEQYKSMPRELRKHFLASGGLHLKDLYKSYFEGKTDDLIDPHQELFKRHGFLEEKQSGSNEKVWSEIYDSYAVTEDNLKKKLKSLDTALDKVKNDVGMNDLQREKEIKKIQNRRIKLLNVLFNGREDSGNTPEDVIQNTMNENMRKVRAVVGNTPQAELLRTVASITSANVLDPERFTTKVKDETERKQLDAFAEKVLKDPILGDVDSSRVTINKTGTWENPAYMQITGKDKDGKNTYEIRLPQHGKFQQAIMLPHEMYHMSSEERGKLPPKYDRTLEDKLVEEAKANNESVSEISMPFAPRIPEQYQRLIPNTSNLSYVATSLNPKKWSSATDPELTAATQASPRAIGELVRAMDHPMQRDLIITAAKKAGVPINKKLYPKESEKKQ